MHGLLLGEHHRRIELGAHVVCVVAHPEILYTASRTAHYVGLGHGVAQERSVPRTVDIGYLLVTQCTESMLVVLLLVPLRLAPSSLRRL